PAGVGKSQFLRAVADLDPNEGSVELDGIPSEAPAWRKLDAYVAPNRAGGRTRCRSILRPVGGRRGSLTTDGGRGSPWRMIKYDGAASGKFKPKLFDELLNTRVESCGTHPHYSARQGSQRYSTENGR